MTNINTISQKTNRLILSIIAIFSLSASKTFAFDLSTYAEKSVLSENRWVKVSVSETGIHLLTAADLRKWGFSDPSKVRVYGYGGRRLSDVLSLETYTDDLPQLQTVTTSNGIYFYAVGPVAWNTIYTTQFRQSSNPFSKLGYYYLTDADVPEVSITRTGTPGAANPTTKFTELIYH